jgi:transcriptional regulator with XRE-family HTH domain
MVETIGKRIAFLRQKNNWTQQSLANWLAMSRVAISHIEMDLTIPSERSITLMAGLFKLSPLDLVEGTTYPRAKAERLPEFANLYTQLELELNLLINDATWMKRLDDPKLYSKCLNETIGKWSSLLVDWNTKYIDEHERNILVKMKLILEELKVQNTHLLE